MRSGCPRSRGPCPNERWPSRAEGSWSAQAFVYNRPVEILLDFDETDLCAANDDPGLPSLRTWCWGCSGISFEESSYDGGGRLPVLFAGSGMGD